MCSAYSEGRPTQTGPVTALCFSPRDELVLAGYDSGLLEIWQHNTVVGHKQVKTRTRKEMYTEHGYVRLITRCVCLCPCVRLQTAPSQRSAPCLITSLLSASWILLLMCWNWCGTNNTAPQGKQQQNSHTSKLPCRTYLHHPQCFFVVVFFYFI